MRYDVRCQKCGAQDEIEKPMNAPLPKCAKCGGGLRRLYNQAPPIQFRCDGFYSTDVLHFQRQVGTERYARFEAERDASLRRMKAGKPTRYEHAAEVAFGRQTRNALSRARRQ